jgi:hypothetical protein
VRVGTAAEAALYGPKETQRSLFQPTKAEYCWDLRLGSLSMIVSPPLFVLLEAHARLPTASRIPFKNVAAASLPHANSDRLVFPINRSISNVLHQANKMNKVGVRHVLDISY